jgi:hypothetical protein
MLATKGNVFIELNIGYEDVVRTHDMHMTFIRQTLTQACSNLYVVRATVAKFSLHTRNMNSIRTMRNE